MTGAMRLEDVPEQWRGIVCGMMLKPIYQHAVRVLAIPDKDGRQRALAGLPDAIRPQVEAEALRIFAQRKAKK